MTNNIKRIISIIILFIILLTSGVFASRIEFNNVVIKFSNGLEINVRTNKTNVLDILKENNILLLDDEIIEPQDKIDFTKTIRIRKKEEKNIKNEAILSLQLDEIINSYGNIVEKIIIEKKEIPFKTINRTADAYSSNNMSVIIQKGQKGLKEVKSRVKYNNDIEIERIELSTKIIKRPQDKIVQIVPNFTSRSGEHGRGLNLAKIASGRNSFDMTVNASAYCACMICCGKTNGITASGKKAQAYYTIAAPKNYPFGTIIYLEYFKDSPSKGWYIVQDRGGAITNNRIDLFYNTHSEALKFGRRNLKAVVFFP